MDQVRQAIARVRGYVTDRLPAWQARYDAITQHPRYIPILVGLFFAILVGYFLAWPITKTDTDLWYHLSGGRYFWRHGSIPREAFFSYVDHPTTWYNYYWLFQVVVYGLHWLGDYYALILLRCAAYALTSYMIHRLLVVRPPAGSAGGGEPSTAAPAVATPGVLSLFLFVSCTLVIMGRELAVRPHLFSYLFIVVFLYILERRHDLALVLPILGVLWANLHGIEFPVMFLIVLAYLAESYWKKLRKAPDEGMTKQTRWCAIGVLYAIFLTPGVTELVQLPFSTTFEKSAYQHLYIQELLPTPFRGFLVFSPITVGGLVATLQNLIVLLALVSVVVLLWQRKLRLSHALLFAGAVALLGKHRRFVYEFTLLSIPLLQSGLAALARRERLAPRLARLAMPAAIVLLPLLVFHTTIGNRPAYPFSVSGLPSGVVSFLNRNGAGGGILNEPNTGGYLQWTLDPKYRIFMDLQMSLFSDLDFATANSALGDANAFARFVAKYQPEFLLVSVAREGFPKVLVDSPGYVPVCFDQAEVLCASKERCPDLVARYELKAIDPFRFTKVQYKDLSEEELAAMQAEALRLHQEDPANYGPNFVLACIANAQAKHDEAMVYADAIAHQHPQLPYGYSLRGDALLGTEQYAEAVRCYELAMALGQRAKEEGAYWNLHLAYARLRQYDQAYRLLSRYINPFSKGATYKEIYQLALCAGAVGKTPEAVLFLDIAGMGVPPSDMEYCARIAEALATQRGTRGPQ